MHVELIGDGAGIITSDPPGLVCGQTCSMTIETRPTTLTAHPAEGSVFSGWVGAGCGQSETCRLSITDDTRLQARFLAVAPISHDVTITFTGDGNGNVQAGSTSCAATCNLSVADGSLLTMSATANPGSRFVGWSGPCAGVVPCMLAIDGPTAVEAQFATLPEYSLTVTRSGSGSGVVTSSPTGIDCGATCSHAFVENTVATLTALPSAGSIFVRWQGACAGQACSVTMSGDRSVEAVFDPAPPAGCTSLVTSSESATAFNLRLATAGARICIADGVTITGRVLFAANDVTVKSLPGATVHFINTGGDAIDNGGRSIIRLIGLDVRAEGPTLSSAIVVNHGSLDIEDSTVTCTATNCYVMKILAGSVPATGNSMFVGGGVYSYGIYGDAAFVHMTNSTITSSGNTIIGFNGSDFTVISSTLRSTNPTVSDESVVKAVHLSTVRVSNSTVVTSGFDAFSIYGPGFSTLQLDSNTIHKAVGSAPGAVSPIRSYQADNVIRSSMPNTFCNDGTAANDGAFTTPLIAGSYAATSTFGAVAHVGPIDCP